MVIYHSYIYIKEPKGKEIHGKFWGHQWNLLISWVEAAAVPWCPGAGKYSTWDAFQALQEPLLKPIE